MLNLQALRVFVVILSVLLAADAGLGAKKGKGKKGKKAKAGQTQVQPGPEAAPAPMPAEETPPPAPAEESAPPPDATPAAPPPDSAPAAPAATDAQPDSAPPADSGSADAAAGMPASPPPEGAPAADAPPPPSDADGAGSEGAPADSMRFRFGASASLGSFIPGPMVNFGAQARLGLQLSQLLGAYASFGYNAGVWLGGSLSSSGASVSASGVGYWYAGIHGELTLGDLFIVGLGPILAGGSWTSVKQTAGSSGASQEVTTAGGKVMPGVDVRLGFGFGEPRDSGRRHQFTLVLGGQLLFAPVSAHVGQSGAGQSVAIGDTAIGFAPMLLIGYDAK